LPGAPASANALKLGIYSNETVGGSYERQLGRYSLQGSLGYWTNSYRTGGAWFVTDSAYYPISSPYRARWHRVALTAQLRRYLQARKPALVGWYAGAGLQWLGEWTHYRYENGPTSRGFWHQPTLQLRIGRQCQLGPRFTFDFNLGPELDMGIRRTYELNPATLTYARTGPRRLYAYPNLGLALQVGYRL
jgi:hypothetical protein